MNRGRYLEVKADVRQKLNELEDRDQEAYHDYQAQFWRLDDYLDLRGLKKLDRELSKLIKDNDE